MKPMIIGPSGAGKTTLFHALAGNNDKAKKTQMINFVGDFIDTPGEYIEIPRFYRALFVSSQQAEIVLLVIAADKYRVHLPTGLAQAFTRPVIGVINKVDLIGADIQSASAVLAQTGAKGPYYHVSAYTGQGICELKVHIESLRTNLIK